MRRLTAVLGLVTVAACGRDGPTPPAPVGSLTLSRDTATLVPTATLQLSANLKDVNGKPVTRAVTWLTSNLSLATVSADGLVTAASTGTVTITATSETKSALVQVTVKDGAIIGAGGGTVTALNGTATLIVPAAALASNVMITMEPAIGAPSTSRLVTGTAVDIGPPNLQFAASAQLQLKYGVSQVPVGASEQLLRIQRAAAGMWQPASGGTADPVAKIVTAAVTTASTYAVLTSPIASVTLSSDHAALDIGGTVQLIATAYDAANVPIVDAPIAWSTADPTIASVSADGLVAAVGPGGPINVTATSNGKSANAAITVTAKQSVGVSATAVSFAGGIGGANPSAQQVAVTAVGIPSLTGLTATVTYPTGAASGWLTATLAAATTPTQVTLAAGMGSLAAGVYGATVTIASTIEGTAPARINVAFVIASPSIVVIAGNNQAAMAGTAVSVPPSVIIKDGIGTPLANAAVTFAVTAGDGSVTSSVVNTDATGIATVGSWTLGAIANPNQLIATVVAPGFSSANNSIAFGATGCHGGGGTGYAITICYVTTMTVSQRAAFEDAATRWGTIITGDISDLQASIPTGACFTNSPSSNMSIDDLLIFARIEPIDGVNGILGAAGPCILRSSNNLPIMGLMRFDVADVANMETNGQLRDVILHEMGHVIGIGTLWPTFRLLANPSAPGGPQLDTHFIGANGIAGFDLIGGAPYAAAKVPVENAFGSGTINAHWRENVLINELMTGFLNSGSNPLSILTVRSLEDFGYTVNAGAADPFQLTIALQSMAQAERRPYGNDVIAGPYNTIDRRGRLTRIK